MLDYFLALVVGFGSLAIYLSAFFFPEIHRQNDFIWSGIGLFYALILWIFAPRITGGLLLGHVASVSLLVWFVAQTLLLRRQLTPAGQQTPFPSPELIKISFQEQMSKFSVKEKFAQLSGFVASVFGGVKSKIEQTVNKKTVIRPAEEILQTTRTEVTPPSKLPDESVTATPTITSEISSGETFSQSSLLDVVEVAPTPPTVIEEQQVIPPTEPETVVEITQTEVVISESSITGEPETVVEVTQTRVIVAIEETGETASAPEISSPNPVTSELLAAESAEKPDILRKLS